MADREFPAFPPDPEQPSAAEVVLEEVAATVDAAPENQPPESEGATSPATGTEHYTIGSWGGIEQFRCNDCAFDSLNLERTEEHWRKVHAPPPPPRPKTGLTSVDGSPL